MAGNPIFSISPGILIPQEGASMRTTEWGFDEGERRWLTHPSTNTGLYPQRNQRDTQFTSMFVRDVIPRQTECGMIEITATYKGLVSLMAGGVNKQRIIPGCDTQLMSLDIIDGGNPGTLLAQVPKDICVREYVTTAQPNQNGVSLLANGAFLPAPAPFSITFTPNPNSAPPPKNYKIGWVLDARTWQDVANAVFLVRETYGYYHTVGS